MSYEPWTLQAASAWFAYWYASIPPGQAIFAIGGSTLAVGVGSDLDVVLCALPSTLQDLIAEWDSRWHALVREDDPPASFRRVYVDDRHRLIDVLAMAVE